MGANAPFLLRDAQQNAEPNATQNGTQRHRHSKSSPGWVVVGVLHILLQLINKSLQVGCHAGAGSIGRI